MFDNIDENDHGQSGFLTPAFPIQPGRVLMLKNFWRPGLIEVNDTTVALKGNILTEFLAMIREEISTDITIYSSRSIRKQTGFVKTTSGAFSFNVQANIKAQNELTSIVFVDGVLSPEDTNKVMSVLSSLEQTYRDSKYWINIRESFWSNRREEVISIYKGYPDYAFSGTISDLYEGVDVDKLLNLFAHSDENVLMMLGEPGTGKTQLIKKTIYDMAIHKNRDITVVYTKDSSALKSNAFWAELHEDGSDILILDDLDNELMPRDDKNSEQENIVSRLLSFSNGVFPIDTKILITSNVTDQLIDKALIRPGRCLDVLQLVPMSIEKANRLWTEYELPVDEFEISFEGHTRVVQSHFMSEVARVRSNIKKNYLLDPNTSVRDKYIKEENKNSGMGFIK